LSSKKYSCDSISEAFERYSLHVHQSDHTLRNTNMWILCAAKRISAGQSRRSFNHPCCKTKPPEVTLFLNQLFAIFDTGVANRNVRFKGRPFERIDVLKWLTSPCLFWPVFRLRLRTGHRRRRNESFSDGFPRQRAPWPFGPPAGCKPSRCDGRIRCLPP
jgi:hypothetical protein